VACPQDVAAWVAGIAVIGLTALLVTLSLGGGVPQPAAEGSPDPGRLTVWACRCCASSST
jgi:hypothetical protein